MWRSGTDLTTIMYNCKSNVPSYCTPEWLSQNPGFQAELGWCTNSDDLSGMLGWMEVHSLFLMFLVILVGKMMGSEKQSCTHSEELRGVLDFHWCLMVVVSLVGIMAGSEKTLLCSTIAPRSRCHVTVAQSCSDRTLVFSQRWDCAPLSEYQSDVLGWIHVHPLWLVVAECFVVIWTRSQNNYVQLQPQHIIPLRPRATQTLPRFLGQAVKVHNPSYTGWVLCLHGWRSTYFVHHCYIRPLGCMDQVWYQLMLWKSNNPYYYLQSTVVQSWSWFSEALGKVYPSHRNKMVCWGWFPCKHWDSWLQDALWEEGADLTSVLQYWQSNIPWCNFTIDSLSHDNGS